MGLESAEVLIVGAGAGLSTAARRAEGIRSVVLEQDGRIGRGWAAPRVR